MGLDLHSERLGTTNADGSRAFVYPADVRGKWHFRRTWVHFVLLAVFLVTPWINFAGEQMFHLDVTHRRFVIMGMIFWAHDAPMLFLLFASVAFSVLFVTVVWGRVWCGWACPQTVFIDAIFRRIERWVEGSHLDRRRLDEMPLSTMKILKKGLKWLLFFAVSLAISHSFIAYFSGSKELVAMMQKPPGENLNYFILVLSVTLVLVFDFGWFREQFCVIMCPYGRVQSVLMGMRTVTVLYDVVRGEPRKGSVEPNQKQGDCVNCFRCVHVCPTGIDIRRGVQLECINCTACIDACDEVMEKVHKPHGLIRYDSMLGTKKAGIFGPRAVFYLAALVVTAGLLFTILSLRQPLDVVFLRAKGEPFELTRVGDEDFVINHFQIKLTSQTRGDLNVEFRLSQDLLEKGYTLATPFRPLPVKMGEIKRTELFVRFPRKTLLNGAGRIEVETIGELEGDHEKVDNHQEVSLVGPFS